MRVLITGAAGQLGNALQRITPTEHNIQALTHAQLDVTREEEIRHAFDHFRPQVVINAAAYTAVDRAESEKERAFAVNAHGAENLAKAALEHEARLIHISTDYVFDGAKSRPYLPSDAKHPLSVYGASKAEGEERIQKVMGVRAVIVRSGWVYASIGKNFVNTILRLLTEKPSLQVISDQIGTPTWAGSLAKFVWTLVNKPGLKGVFHWSDAGVASWYDFAVAIEEEAFNLRLIPGEISIQPVSTEVYPLPAKRPAYSVLETQQSIKETGETPCHWRSNLKTMLKEVAHA